MGLNIFYVVRNDNIAMMIAVTTIPNPANL